MKKELLTGPRYNFAQGCRTDCDTIACTDVLVDRLSHDWRGEKSNFRPSISSAGLPTNQSRKLPRAL